MIRSDRELQVLHNPPLQETNELILEIELNGKMKLEHLMNAMYRKFGICHRVLSAQIEYLDGRDFGYVQLYIDVSAEDHQRLEHYLIQNRLLSTSVAYTCRKYT